MSILSVSFICIILCVAVQAYRNVGSAASCQRNCDFSMSTSGGVNLPLEGVLNMRDLRTANPSIISESKLFRCGCVSRASSSDMQHLRKLGVAHLIDLRSERELKDDDELDGAVYEGYGKSKFDVKKGEWVVDESHPSKDGKMRYFIEIMSESIVKKGVFFRLRKRDRARAIIWGVIAGFSQSQRADTKAKKVFVDYINKGGLVLLNELVIDMSPKLLVEVLKIAAKENTPVAYYCTAGKDRTGLVSMLILNVLGVSDGQIVSDYVLSDGAYRALNDKKAMVACLEQVDLNPDVFLTAKAHVIEETMAYMRQKFGSIDGFLDEYGFDETWREKLRAKGRL